MNRKLQLTICCVILSLLCITACHEYDMGKYAEQPVINFATIDQEGHLNQDATAMKGELFFTYSDGLEDTLRGIVVVRQGRIDDRALDISLMIHPVEGMPAPDITILNKCHIASGEYLDSVKIVVKCPPLQDTAYGVDLVFDYANSNVSAGVAERQAFRVEVTNSVWKSTGITPQIWEEVFAPFIGKFSRVKARFMVETGEMELPDIADMMDQDTADYFIRELENYNTAHPGAPLRDEYGNQISFQPE